MPDTKAGRDKKGHDEEQQQREDELEAELEYDAAADKRRADRDDAEAANELANDE